MTREQLIHLLCEAAEIEHNLLCSYLYAMFSLKGDEDLESRERSAVARWRKSILGVAVEEMGHLLQVNNLLVAIGGSAHFDRPNLPVAPGYHPAGFVIRLTPFTAETLDHFIYLERPADIPLEDGSTFDQPDARPRTRTVGTITPSSSDYATIGEFYDQIRNAFVQLGERFGRDAFLDRDGGGQVGPDMVELPGIARVTSLDGALAAIDDIVEQGEGASRTHEGGHFFHFSRIKKEWAGLLDDDPSFEPAHPAAHDPVMRRPARDVERRWITHPRAAELLDLGNAVYGFMLVLLEQVFAPGRTSAQRRASLDATIGLMHLLSPIASALVRTPADDSGAVTAGLTFAVPRHFGQRAPGVAAITAVERMRELADGWQRVMPGSPVEDTLASIFARLEMLR